MQRLIFKQKNLQKGFRIMSVYSSRHTDSIPITRQYPGPNVTTQPTKGTVRIAKEGERRLGPAHTVARDLVLVLYLSPCSTDKPGEQTALGHQHVPDSLVQRLLLKSSAGDVESSFRPREAV